MTQTAISTSFSTQALTVTPSLQSAAPSPCRHPLLSSGLVQGTLLYTWLAPGSGHPKEGGEASRTSVWGGHGQWYASMFEGIVLVLWERSGVGWWRGVGVDQDGRDQDGRGGPC